MIDNLDDEQNAHKKNGNENSIIERQSVLDFFKDKADNKAEIAYRYKLRRERETFELLDGRTTSIFIEQFKNTKLIESIPQNHSPKYSQFFIELGKLANWTEEESKRFAKPHIAPRIINKYIYSRFPTEVFAHFLDINPYIKFWLRKYKHYLFLGEDGIIMLEKFIDDTITIMKRCKTVYEFEKEYSSKFGIGFQPKMFEEYLGLIKND